MLCITDFGVVLRITTIMPDSAQMPEQLACGNRPFFLRKCRTVVLHWHIQIQFSSLPKLHRGRRCQRLGYRCQTVQRARGCRNKILQVGHAIALGPLIFAILHHGDRYTWHAVCRHELRNRTLDLSMFFRRKLGVLGGNHRSCCYDNDHRRPDRSTQKFPLLSQFSKPI